MRLSKSVSKNATSLYVIESTYIHGKSSTRTVESLGTLEELSKIHDDPIAWAKAYIDELNKKQKSEREKNQANSEVLIKLNASKQIAKDTQYVFNGGYLFLQKIFYQLGINEICQQCQLDTKTKYNLTEILSCLVYNRILEPGSKLRAYEFSKTLIENSHFELKDIYRALSLLSKNIDFIQSQIYTNSMRLGKRNDRILYYDCTNYFFEIENEDDFRKYGYSKEHRPNPLVGMGLFMDEDGIPLAFSIFPGNCNEQHTLTPLEEKIEEDFKHSKFIVCTDAGLSSSANKLFNSKNDKAFITTQSIKKLSNDNQDWALEKEHEWKELYSGGKETFSLKEIEKDEEEAVKKGEHSKYYTKIFYKEKADILEVEINENGKKKFEYVDQKIYVTYSLKYRDYLRYIRNGQIERAAKMINTTSKNGKQKKEKFRQNDYRRFLESVSFTDCGEVAENFNYTLKEDLIEQEEKYDGFYAVATNLDASAEEIIEINKKRWKIEECFRITKTNFNSRPVYLSREERIRSHFLICFIALIIYRLLERKVSTDEKRYTTDEILSQLKNMNFMASSGNGYIPIYTRTDFTDRLHQAFNFRTDYEIIPLKNMKKIIQNSKTL